MPRNFRGEFNVSNLFSWRSQRSRATLRRVSDSQKVAPCLNIDRLEDRCVPASMPTLLKDIYPGIVFSDPTEFTDVNGVCFFAAYDGHSSAGGHYRELWKSDGTTQGTVLIKDIYPGSPNSSDPQKLTAVGSTLYFTANDGVNGRELWKSDGTAAGTVMVADLTPGADSSNISNLRAAGGKLFFTFATAAAGEELWVSDGTAAGTFMVKDIQPGPNGSIPNPMASVAFNGLLYFSADNGASGYELWRSDGTSTGTVLVVDISQFGSSFPSQLTAFANGICFSTLVGVYVTTGAVGNFTQIHVSQAASIVNANGTLYFSKREQTGVPAEIWKSDGTPGGTVLVKQLPLGNQGGFQPNPGPLYAIGPFVAFSFNDGVNGFEPWRTDGTDAGTQLIADIRTGSASSDPGLSGVAVLDGFVYFSANNGTNGTELWRSDGTAAGTTLTLDINPGSGFGFNGQLQRVGSNLYFSGYQPGVSGIEPWIVRGSKSLKFKGNTDLVGRNAATGAIYVGKSNGENLTTTVWGAWSPGVQWLDVKVGDFNGDGIADLAGRAASNGQWYVSLSNGATAFTTSLFGAWSAGAGVAWTDVQVGDFNGDGKDDIVGRWAQTGQWWVAESNGSAFVNRYYGQWSPGVTWLDVVVGDYDADGKADVAGRISEYGQWWVGRSTGTAFANQYFGAWSTTNWDDVRVGDFNGDGKSDLVGRLRSNGQWYAAISTGTAFANSLWGLWSAGLDWTNVQVGDVNGDGKEDLVGRWNQTGQWWVAQSTGTSFQNKYFGAWTNTVTWVDVLIGDFNNDGLADMAGRIGNNGQWYVAKSTGTAFANQYFGAWLSTITWVDVAAAEFGLG